MIKDHNLVLNKEARLGAIQQRKLQVLVWWTKDFQISDIVIIASVQTAAELTSSITQINIEYPLGGQMKVAHPDRAETGHKLMTWDVKWENYIGSMVRLSDIPLDQVTRHDMPVGWTVANKHDHLKYQEIQIGPAWESNKMSVYTKLKACCLDDQVCSWIK